MEVPSHEVEGDQMPIPLNSTYGGGHGHHSHGHMIHHDPTHNHINIPTNGPGPISSSTIDDHVPFKKVIRYRECLKNHAAAMGGNATDGCGEFMPSGEEGTLEALTCSACNCHRNFHRKEVEGEHPSSCDHINCYQNVINPRMASRKQLFMGAHHHKGTYLGPDSAYHHHHHLPSSHGALISSRAIAAPHQMLMSYNMGIGGSLPSESDEQEEGNGGVMVRPPQMVKKRFRTKFTQEQKEKMHNFAEKVGWKIQKQEESVVQQFCQEVGVKRRVLKVWMHNNKHNLAKKNLQSNPQNQL
ncbi:hypothetical protein CDL12_26121 [Handroanthus impetiginosus]|uniref:ZF-HD dimerization-type domain-containing protein n=1 Tax=Handroanthus impetiginosus TaxID=429701 RepID=A0A2G9G8R2_9LAMI|nr:hypothetical protein CDL12_26121 [Handroanthus impetiginosus]